MGVLISILLPAYNVEKYIRDCLESIVSQDCSNCEVIVVDDGSTDLSGSICDEYSVKYPTLIKTIHKENGGLLSARREGINQAKGKYCMFVDSDDYLLPDAIKEIKSTISNNSNPDVIIYNYKICDESKEILEDASNQFEDGRVFEGQDKLDIYRKIIKTSSLNAIWIKLFKTELLRSDPMDYSDNINNSYGEDILQSLYPLTFAKKIVYLGRPLYCYRINTSGMIHTYTIESLNRKTLDDRVSQAVMSYIEKWGLNDRGSISSYLTREINSILQSIRVTASNIPLKSDRCDALYSSMRMIEEKRYLNRKIKFYNESNLIKRIYVTLYLKRKYRLVHYLSRAMRGYI